jgi:hypothetical protein
MEIEMEVQIRNSELIEQLDGFINDFYAIEGFDDPVFHMYDPKDARENGILYTSEEYLHKQMALGSKHTGFPEQHFSQPVGQMAQRNPDQFADVAFRVRKKFPVVLGVHSSALFNYYPPGGFVGWHTNWNANAYQILFTWSKTGDGYFRYWDNQEKKIVHIEDKPGWQCRWYYFGREDEPDYHCWHAAYAGCDRFTLAYKFVNDKIGTDKDRQAIIMRDQLIEEIEEE